MPQDNKAPTRLQGVGVSGLAGVQRGLSADLLGLPVDTVANVADLGLAGYGTVVGLMGRQDLMPDLLDRSQVVGSGDWIARQLSRTGALMGPADSGSGVERAAFAFGRGGAGALLGAREGPARAVEAGMRGGVSMLAAEQAGSSTGNPALAASAALAIGSGRRYSNGIARSTAGGKDDRPALRIPVQGELDWQRFIAHALSRALPVIKNLQRGPERPDRIRGAGNAAPHVKPGEKKALVPQRPDGNSMLNSAEYRSYRAGMDEFGLQRDPPARKGLGKNPFYGKNFPDIDQLLTERDFSKKGRDPSAGIGSYFHPKSGRKYYLDEGQKYGRNYELPHVDVHRMKDGINLRKEKRKFPLGEELFRKEK
ncbi:hypothetical protein [Solimonas sp. SE-A11]|uniref:hypothetical protein n=1 Tax=Solimonas sp. SE-A11 TaxID=3054954 RepID=UPI00259C791D|nr:hypothetical protein [Solimonas sp. SE-A11]MDM4773070.1 hypothetical protein [Solimonas sp. SE-A11]